MNTLQGSKRGNENLTYFPFTTASVRKTAEKEIYFDMFDGTCVVFYVRNITYLCVAKYEPCTFQHEYLRRSLVFVILIWADRRKKAPGEATIARKILKRIWNGFQRVVIFDTFEEIVA